MCVGVGAVAVAAIVVSVWPSGELLWLRLSTLAISNNHILRVVRVGVLVCVWVREDDYWSA